MVSRRGAQARHTEPIVSFIGLTSSGEGRPQVLSRCDTCFLVCAFHYRGRVTYAATTTTTSFYTYKKKNNSKEEKFKVVLIYFGSKPESGFNCVFGWHFRRKFY